MLRLPVLIFLLAFSMSLPARQLAPPDVDFFGWLHYSQTDLNNLGLDDRVDGTRLGGGLWFNDVRPFGWRFGIETGYNNMGKASARFRDQRNPNAGEQNRFPQATKARVKTKLERDISGLELGMRLYDNELLYVRAGGYLYHYSGERNKTVTLIDEGSGNTQSRRTTPNKDDTASLAPYLGLGLAVPLTQTLQLNGGVSVYHIESESLSSFSVGLEYTPLR